MVLILHICTYCKVGITAKNMYGMFRPSKGKARYLCNSCAKKLDTDELEEFFTENYKRKRKATKE